MADFIRVKKECQPWTPGDDTQLVKVLQRYSIPLVGITSQHGADFLFWCALGQTEEHNIWFYTHVSEGERDQVLAAKPEDLRAALMNVTSGRACVVAYASEEDGIIHSVEYDGGVRFGGPYSPPIEVLGQSLRAEMERLRAAENEVDALAATGG